VAGLQTEFNFTLPKGFIDSDGALHRTGTMRLATARDEIEPLRDPRVTGPDDPYLTILVLARVVTELGSLTQVTVREVENLFAADLAFLQHLLPMSTRRRSRRRNRAPLPNRPPRCAGGTGSKRWRVAVSHEALSVRRVVG
jgi:hypothetical protein